MNRRAGWEFATFATAGSYGVLVFAVAAFQGLVPGLVLGIIGIIVGVTVRRRLRRCDIVHK